MAFLALELTILIIVGIVALVSSESSDLVTYIFGDSLTEVGNNNFLQYSLAKSNFPYYGIDLPGGQPTGRFTNGRTIGDIISTKLGIASPPAYLSLSPNADAILKGVNYASGGAGILNETGLYFIQRLSFDDQIKNFEKTREVIKMKLGGDQAAEKFCNEAMYFIGLGSNDYVNNFLQPFLADSQQYTHDEFVGLLISTLEQQLVTLHQLGARKMVFHGLGPLGCIPSQRVKSRRGQCLKQVNAYVLEFNSKVQNLMAQLNRQLPGAQLTFADTYESVLDLINNPTTYGNFHVLRTVCILSGPEKRLDNKKTQNLVDQLLINAGLQRFKISNTSCCNVDTNVGGLCLPNSKLCRNRREYVFWDAFHPSDAANAILADKFFATLFSTKSNSSASAPAPSPSH